MEISLIMVLVWGICVGSFLNVCIYRIPAGKSVVLPASHCGACGQKLGFIDLVPVVSYLYLRGKCRWCQQPFSWRYPLVELVTGLLFVVVWLELGPGWAVLAGWTLVSIMVAITVIDIDHGIIPDRIIIAGLVLGIPLVALQSWGALKSGVLAFLAAGIFMLAIAVISRRGMGGGDIKLAALMGLYLGLKGVGVALFLGFLAGGLVGIVLLATGIKGRKDAIPFGPYLALGGVLALFWANEIISWYWHLWR